MNFITIATNVNVGPILEELDEHPELWNQMDLRTTHPMTPHKEVDDIVLRFNDLSNGISAAIDDAECHWYNSAFILPIKPLMYALMSDVYGDRIGRAVITRLKPGSKIDSHIDYGSPVSHYQRFHISLLNEEGAVFTVDGENFTPKTGDVFVVANHKEHSVVNNSSIDRLTMIIDIRTKMFENLKVTK